MDLASKFLRILSNDNNKNTLINVCLVFSFAALSARSIKQERQIEALEAEKNSLLDSNKALKKTMWDWKQQLFAEASTQSALVPLARIKAIYGEAPISPSGIIRLPSLWSVLYVFYFLFEKLVFSWMFRWFVLEIEWKWWVVPSISNSLFVLGKLLGFVATSTISPLTWFFLSSIFELQCCCD